MSARRSHARDGLTLIEVLVALVLLSGVAMGMSSYAAKFIRGTADASIRSTAGDLVSDRLEQIKGYGRYGTLESTYNGTESSMPGYANFTRRTDIVRVNTTTNDYKTITVTVTHPGLRTAVKKTTVISAF